MSTLIVSPQSSGDDGEYNDNLFQYVNTGPSISIGSTGATYYNANIRFPNINIPKDSTINSAFIDFVASASDSSTDASMRFWGELSNNASQISNASDFIARTRTSAFKNWALLPTWTIGNTYTSPDIKNIIQEIINGASWIIGNALQIFIFNVGSNLRHFASYDNVTYTEPILTIDFTSSVSTKSIVWFTNFN